MSLEVMDKVNTLLAQVDLPERHTFFQMKNFIVGKEPTLQAQLWQVVKELRARSDSFRALQLQLDDQKDELELAEINYEVAREMPEEPEEKDNFGIDQPKSVAEIDRHKRRRRIMIRKALRHVEAIRDNLKKLETKIKYLLEEVTYLVGAYETLSKVEPIKPLDDVAAQKQYWNEKFAEELNLRLLLKNPLDSEFVRTVLALDDDAPVKKQMVAIIQRIQDDMIARRDRDRAAQVQIDSPEVQARITGNQEK